MDNIFKMTTLFSGQITQQYPKEISILLQLKTNIQHLENKLENLNKSMNSNTMF